MQLNKIIFMLFMLIIILGTGCSSKKVIVDEDNQEWYSHFNTNYYYKILYPTNWEYEQSAIYSDENKEKFDSFILEEKGCDDPNNNLDCIKNIVSSQLSIYVLDSENLSLNEWIDTKSFQSLYSKTGNYTLNKTVLDYKIAGFDAIRVSNIYPKEVSKDFDKDVVMDNIYLKRGSKIFYFSLFNQRLPKEEYESIIEKMLRSFSSIK